MRTLKVFSNKSLTMSKKLKGGPLFSPGIVCYAEKGTTFIFQFLLPNGTVLFDTLKFRRTLNHFEKKTFKLFLSEKVS